METYKTTGVCAKEVQFEIEDNKIRILILNVGIGDVYN